MRTFEVKAGIAKFDLQAVAAGILPPQRLRNFSVEVPLQFVAAKLYPPFVLPE